MMELFNEELPIKAIVDSIVNNYSPEEQEEIIRNIEGRTLTLALIKLELKRRIKTEEKITL